MKGKPISAALLGLLMLLAFFMLSSLGAAETQCLTEVSTSTSTSRATTGTSVTVTVATTGSSCTISTLSCVSTPSLTVNDPSSGQYSGFSAGTSKAFAVTAGTAGTYTYYSRGTTTAGSVDSTSQILEFVSPSDLTITPSPSSATVTSSNSFNLTMNVQNPQTSDISTSYALNLPSGLTRQSGDPASSSATTISASSTKALVFEIKHSTCFTGSKTITFDLGGSSGAASVTVTGNTSCTSTTTTTSSSSSSGSSSSSSSNTTSNVLANYNITVVKMAAGTTSSVNIMDANIAVKQVMVDVNADTQNVKVSASRLAAKPSYITNNVNGSVYQYLDLTLTNLPASSISSGKIRFNMTKQWFTSYGFQPSHVSAYRYYVSDWQKLNTSMISESSTEYQFEAATPGFSVFVISAYKPAVANQTISSANQTTPTENQTVTQTLNQTGNQTGNGTVSATDTGVGTAFPQDMLYVILAVLVMIILFVVYHIILKNKPVKYEFKPKK
ncbi:PGF-pre-PGF domain-containing protein [archaeon]|nr:PGF-pre-PGF domain-containing protein [archaeon]